MDGDTKLKLAINKVPLLLLASQVLVTWPIMVLVLEARWKQNVLACGFSSGLLQASVFSRIRVSVRRLRQFIAQCCEDEAWAVF